MARKGENIYKRKDGRWEARYIRGYNENGDAKYGYIYAQSYHEAKARLEQAKIDFSLGEAVSAKTPLKISALCDEWLSVNRHKIAESSYVKYFSVIRIHIKPAFGGLRIEALTTTAISDFSNALLTVNGLSPSSVCDILTILGSILKYARKKIGAKMPYVEIIQPKLKRKEMRVLTLDEQRRMVEHLRANLDARNFGILLALLTGMRIGEICALRWENVSFEERCIKVESTMQRLQNLDGQTGTRLLISSPKTENSQRVIPLTDYAVELCRKFRASESHAFVLRDDTRQFYEPRLLQYRFKRVVSILGLDGVHFHTLRHTFATRCVEVGFEIKSLSEILGHSSPSITLERYVHTSFELKRENMQKLCAIGF